MSQPVATMKTQTFLVVVVCLLSVAFTSAEDKLYNSKYDNFDIDGILSNERILKNYIKCLMDEGSCTPEGKDFKRALPEVLETSCTRCTPAQKTILRKLLKFIKENKPEDWEKLGQKYDPEGKYNENIKRFELGDM